MRLARKGHEGVAAVPPATPQLVLMDLRMPEMDGLEATRRIKQDHPELPVLALTANASEEDRVACRLAGMSELVSKPVTSRRLQMAISDVMGKKNGQL